MAAGAAIAMLAAEAFLVRVLRYRNSVLQWFASLLLCLIGGPFLWLHLKVVDRFYISWGPKYRTVTSIPAKKAVVAAKHKAAS